ncbi:MAG: MucR family transcriptional regulator [Rhizobiaceae bacterium]
MSAKDDLIAFTADIVAAYVSKNDVQASGLPALISQVHAAMTGLTSEQPPREALRPPVPIKKSVTPDYIICLEDGKKYKSLKRHLGSAYGMTPDQYRQKWGLPPDYPMVAPNYAVARSELAKATGLGRIPTGVRRNSRRRAA